MGKSQREKGARGELEARNILREHGVDSRRGQVFNKEPDLVDESAFHWEVKRAERIELPKWWKQSVEQCRGKIPTVIHRRSREPWLITLALEDFLKVIDERYKG